MNDEVITFTVDVRRNVAFITSVKTQIPLDLEVVLDIFSNAYVTRGKAFTVVF